MKLVVNASTLSLPLTGIGRYTRYLLEQLMLREDITEILGIQPFKTLNRALLRQRIEECDRYEEGHSVTSQTVSLKQDLFRAAREVPSAHEAKLLLERAAALYHRKNSKHAIYWEPGYLLLPLDRPSISTVYDLSHLEYPECHPAARVSLLEKHLEKSIERSQKVVVISEFTRQQVIKNFALAQDKIVVVPPAVSDIFRQPKSLESLQDLRRRYQLPTQFILSVCTLEPRKNLLGLLEAYRSLPSVLRKQYPLVLVGAKGWRSEKLDLMLSRLCEKGEVIRLGYVAQQDLPLLFSAADLLAYISFYEGYGMPVAEAMASGTAVITSNCTSMPEVANGTNTLVNPYDIEEISTAMRRLLEDARLRQVLAEQGLEKSALYTWKHSADKLFNAIESL